jgi:hypothetical protein
MSTTVMELGLASEMDGAVRKGSTYEEDGKRA